MGEMTILGHHKGFPTHMNKQIVPISFHAIHTSRTLAGSHTDINIAVHKRLSRPTIDLYHVMYMSDSEVKTMLCVTSKSRLIL